MAGFARGAAYFFASELSCVKPVLQALLVADHVYVDKLTNKKIVTGIFHRMTITKKRTEQTGDEPIKIEIPQSGFRAGSPYCYIGLTEVRGKQAFTLRYVNLENDQALFQTEFEATCTNPLETVEVVLALPTLPIIGAGRYALELLWGQEPIGCHRITVVETSGNEE